MVLDEFLIRNHEQTHRGIVGRGNSFEIDNDMDLVAFRGMLNSFQKLISGREVEFSA